MRSKSKYLRSVWILMIGVLTLAMILGACSPAAPAAEEDAAPAAEQEAAPPDEADAAPAAGEEAASAEETETLKIALLLASSIDDGGWSQSSYQGFIKAEEAFGFEGAYTESIALPDQEAVVRNYVNNGYQVIVLSSADFTDVGVNMALEFPDVKFILINGNAAQEPNLANYRPLTVETGFIAGAFSALVSQTGAVGIVNGQKFPPVEDAAKGFEAGALYINPDADVRVAYTDSWTDVQKANEAALGMVEAGVDVLASNCSNGVAGVVDAAIQNGILMTGYIGDQHDLAPGTIPFSAIQDIGMVIYAGIEDVVNDEFVAAVIPVGVKENVISLSPFYTIGEDPVPQEIQDRMNEILQGIADGSLKESGVVPKSVFEQ